MNPRVKPMHTERERAQDPQAQRQGARDIHVELPSVEGLLAGTLALMTGYAQRSAGMQGQRDGQEQGATHSELMARKIASNLSFLKTHPCLSLPFAAVLGNLQTLWADISAAQTIQKPQATSMWHGVAAAVQ